jgi:hypothetical protein
MSQPAGPEKQAPRPHPPRRLVRLVGDRDSAVAEVLREYPPETAPQLTPAEVERAAAERPGQSLAAEWLGPTGWQRFLVCRK